MKTTPAQHTTFTAFLALALAASVCWGAKGPISAKDREKQSTHIVTGKVVAVESKIQKSQYEKSAGNEDKVLSIKVLVETLIKGEGIKKDDEILVTAWKPHTRIGLARLGLQGHVPIPNRGQSATFYLKQSKGVFEPLMPNGIEISSGEAQKTPSKEVRESSSKEMQSYAVFKRGQGALVRLVYSGGIKKWDAGFAVHTDGTMWTLNSATIILTDGKGTTLAPRKGQISGVFRNMWMKKPFDVTVDLAKLYDMSKAGEYTLEWGCRNVKTQKIRIQVVE